MLPHGELGFFASGAATATSKVRDRERELTLLYDQLGVIQGIDRLAVPSSRFFKPT